MSIVDISLRNNIGRSRKLRGYSLILFYELVELRHGSPSEVEEYFDRLETMPEAICRAAFHYELKFLANATNSMTDIAMSVAKKVVNSEKDYFEKHKNSLKKFLAYAREVFSPASTRIVFKAENRKMRRIVRKFHDEIDEAIWQTAI